MGIIHISKPWPVTLTINFKFVCLGSNLDAIGNATACHHDVG